MATLVKPLEFSSENEAREARDAALSSSDWVVVKSLEAGEAVPEEWIDYRQALRDISDQPSFPSMVLFPVEPT